MTSSIQAALRGLDLDVPGPRAVKILVFGAGIIGSVYAGKLIEAGHDVTLLARGQRLTDLQSVGLLLENAESGDGLEFPVTAVSAPDAGARFDVVVVAVRSEQLLSTLPLLRAMTDASVVLFFGNAGGHSAELVRQLGAPRHVRLPCRWGDPGASRGPVRADQPAEDNARGSRRRDLRSGAYPEDSIGVGRVLRRDQSSH